MIPLVLIALLAIAGTTTAGGWATVSMAQPPSDVTPGEETTVELTVLQHGATPVDWPRITIVATNSDTGAVVRADADASSSRLGLYEAALILPTEGAWAITYESPDLVMEGTASLRAIAAAPVVVASEGGLLPIALVAITLLLLAALALVMVRTSRHAIEPREQPLASGG
jgi:hypothetical protein